MSKITWVEGHSDDPRAKRIPKWAMRAGVDQDGTVWVPSLIAGSSMEVFLCAGYDGTPAILVGDHAYYPSDWMKREFPITVSAIERLEETARAAVEGGGQ